jgi:uncharacterized protein
VNDDALSPAVLSALPIFPLPDCVLLPGALLPLNVFEPRYREMTRDCLAGHRVMAIARLRPGYEADYHGRPPVFTCIGIGQIIESEEQEDGRFLLALRGLARAEVAEELPPRRAYREVRARLLVDTDSDPSDLESGHEQLVALCDRLAQLVEGGAGLRDLVRAGSPIASADTVAAVLLNDPDERQRQLECLSPQLRLERTVHLVGGIINMLATSRN